MKTKKQHNYFGLFGVSLIAMIVALMGLVSCENPTDPTDPETPLTDGSGVIKFSVESATSWMVKRSSDSEHIKITPSSGSAGITEVTIMVKRKTGDHLEKIDFGQNSSCIINHSYLGTGIFTILIVCPSKSAEVSGFQQEKNVVVQIQGTSNPNPAKTINLSKCPTLTALSLVVKEAEEALFTDLDLSNTQIVSQLGIFMNNENPRTLNLKGLKNLKALNCKQLEKFDFSKMVELNSLAISESKLKSIDLSKNTKLETLEIANNSQLTEVYLKTGQSIKNLKKDSHTVIKYK